MPTPRRNPGDLVAGHGHGFVVQQNMGAMPVHQHPGMMMHQNPVNGHHQHNGMMMQQQQRDGGGRGGGRGAGMPPSGYAMPPLPQGAGHPGHPGHPAYPGPPGYPGHLHPGGHLASLPGYAPPPPMSMHGGLHAHPPMSMHGMSMMPHPMAPPLPMTPPVPPPVEPPGYHIIGDQEAFFAHLMLQSLEALEQPTASSANPEKRPRERVLRPECTQPCMGVSLSSYDVSFKPATPGEVPSPLRSPLAAYALAPAAPAARALARPAPPSPEPSSRRPASVCVCACARHHFTR